MPDDTAPSAQNLPLDDEARWVTLHVHGRNTAIEEGILIPQTVEFQGQSREVAITDRVRDKYGQSPRFMQQLIQRGLNSLTEPQPGDTDYQRVRVVHHDTLVVQDREGISFMDSDDFGTELPQGRAR